MKQGVSDSRKNQSLISGNKIGIVFYFIIFYLLCFSERLFSCLRKVNGDEFIDGTDINK